MGEVTEEGEMGGGSLFVLDSRVCLSPPAEADINSLTAGWAGGSSLGLHRLHEEAARHAAL